ncbi:MAG: hypothetical protein Fur0037_04570 [Planctomycetota bacterium]
MRRLLAHLALLALAIPSLLAARNARAQAPRSTFHELDGFPQSRYFRIDPVPGTKTPRKGLGLLVVLPGGDGGSGSLPWVEREVLPRLPADFVGVLVTAPKWGEDRVVVWPTRQSGIEGMRYATEDYVAAVVRDVRRAHAIDPARTLLLAWSSSGPAAYAILQSADSPFRRAYVAMSAFRGLAGDARRRLGGARVVLDHSPDDGVVPFRFARKAFEELTEAGAIVRLSTHGGGHGWRDGSQKRLAQGFSWLLGDEPAPPPDGLFASPNLLANGGFEQGLGSWQVFGNSGTMTASIDDRVRFAGRGALHLRKTGKGPVDLVRQEIRRIPPSVIVSLRLRHARCGAAIVRFSLFDRADRRMPGGVELARLSGDGGWRRVERRVDARGAAYAILEVEMALDGEVWLDDAVVAEVPEQGS